MENKIFCSNCGQENEAGTQFCPKCGNKLGVANNQQSQQAIGNDTNGNEGKMAKLKGNNKSGIIMLVVGIVFALGQFEYLDKGNPAKTGMLVMGIILALGGTFFSYVKVKCNWLLYPVAFLICGVITAMVMN